MSPGTKAAIFGACAAATGIVVGTMLWRGAPPAAVLLAAALSLGLLFLLLRGAGRG